MLLHQAVDAGLAATRAEVAVDLDCGQVRNIDLSLKPDISPDDRWRIPMKTMILAAVAALSLGVGAAYARRTGWLPRTSLWRASQRLIWLRLAAR